MCSTPGRRTASKTHHRPAPRQSYVDYSAIVARSNTAYERRQQEKKLQMLNSVVLHVKVARIDHVACPLHILELKRNLNEIDISETLKVIPGNSAVLSDLTAACHSLGHETELIDHAGTKELYVTRLY